MIGQRTRGLLVVFATAMLCCIATPKLCIAQTETKPADLLRFRRVLATKTNLDEFIRSRKNQAYLPIKQEQFDQLIAPLRSGADAPGISQVSIGTASYSATLDGNQLIGGSARLQVKHGGDDPVALSIDASRLPIHSIVWKSKPGEEVAMGAAADGKLLIEVDRSDELLVGWSLAGQGNSESELVFPLALPASPASTLQLDLPLGWRPRIEFGVVSIVEESSETPPDSRALVQWKIQLGGHSSNTLRIERDSTLKPKAPSVRPEFKYDITASGYRLTANLDLNISDRSVHSLVFHVEPNLSIASVKLGEQTLRLSAGASDQNFLPTDGQPGGHTRYEAVFEKPFRGRNRKISVVAIGKQQTANSFDLPMFQLEGFQWLESSTEIRVDEALQVTQLDISGGKQIGFAPATPQVRQETFRFQSWLPSSRIRIATKRRKPKLRGAYGTKISLGQASIAGRMDAEFSVNHGEVFEIGADLPAAWIVDDVDVEPASALEDWSVEPLRARRQGMRLRLQQAVTSERKITVTVHAHQRASAVNQPIQIEQLRLVRFHNVSVDADLLHVSADSNLKIQTHGDNGANWLAVEDLTEAQQERLRSPRRGLLLRNDTSSDGLSFSAISEGVRYSASLSTIATIDGTRLHEHSSLEVKPTGSFVDMLRVHFSVLGKRPPRFYLEGPSENIALKANRIEGETAGNPVGEIWEVLLPSPQDKSFVIIADRVSDIAKPRALSLPSLPQAETQTGNVSIGGEAIQIERPTLRASTTLLVNKSNSLPIRASYIYSPSQTVDVVVGPKKREQASVWAWSGELNSKRGENSSEFTVVYRLENWGQSSLTLRLPEGVIDPVARVSNATWMSITTAEPTQISLPENERFPVLEVKYRCENMSRSTHSILSPEISCPVMAWRCTTWLPPGVTISQVERYGVLKRLLGPLHRSKQKTTFNPFRQDDWRELVGRDSRSQRLQQLSVLTLGNLQRPALPESESLTWGDLLKNLSTELEENDAALLIDQHALASTDIHPEAIPLLSEFGSLSETGLGIIVDTNSVFLTSQIELARLGNETTSSPFPEVVYATVEAGKPPLSLTSSAVYSSAGQWAEESVSSSLPWQANDQNLPTVEAIGGWTAFHMTTDPTAQPILKLHRFDQIRAMSWALFVLAVICGFSFLLTLPRLRIGVILCSGLFAVLAPTVFASLGSFVLWGSLLGLLLGLVWRIRKSETPPPLEIAENISLGSTRMIRTSASLIVLLVLGALATRAISEEPNPIYEVILPVDEEMKPVGDYIWLPQPFYDSLYRMSSGAAKARRDWLIRSVVYECELERTSATSQLLVSDFAAVFDLDVRVANAKVRLPLEGARLSATTAQLDGAPIEWTDDGESLTIEIENAGRYELVVPLHPTTTNDGDYSQFNFAGATCPSAQLRVKMPLDAEGVESPTALGASQFDFESGELIVQVGPTKRVSLRWLTRGETPSKSRLRADQLIWIRYRPNSVTYDTKLTWETPSDEPLSSVSIAVDPRLTLLPLAEDSPVKETSAKVEWATGERLVTLTLDRAYSGEELSLQLTFVANSDPAVGYSPLYRIQPLNGTVKRRLLAVSTVPTLHFEPPKVNYDSIPVNTFMQAWGNASPNSATQESASSDTVTPEGATSESAPDTAYRYSELDIDWYAHLSPLQAVPEVTDISQQYFIQGNKAEFNFEATVNAPRGAFQNKIQLPAEIRIEQVRLTGKSVEQSPIYAITPEGLLTIFQSQPLLGEYQIKVKASLPVSFGTTMQQQLLPVAYFPSNSSAPQKIALYCGPTTRISNVSPKGLVALGESETTTADFQPGRQIGVWALGTDHPKDANVEISLARNRPRVTARQLTWLSRVDNKWEAGVVLDFNVQRGQLNTIRLEAPIDWMGEITSDPDAKIEIAPTPFENRHQIIIHPTEPITGRAHYTVKGFLSTPSSERLEAPDVRMQGATSNQRFFALPIKVQSQRFSWETSGLIQRNVPEILGDDLPASAQFATFLVENSRAKATIEDVQRRTGVPQIRLADIHFACRPSGDCYGLAAFDLEPADLRSCEIEFPIGYRLIRASVAGSPALLSQNKSQGRWELQLGPDQLPQRIVVLFEGDAPEANGKRHFAAPLLKGIPVERTLWTVYSDPAMGAGESLTPDKEIDQERQNGLRRKSLATIIARADDILLESEPQAESLWRALWLSREDIFRDPLVEKKKAAVAESFDPSWSELNIWLDEHAGNGASTRFAFRGQVDHVDIRYQAAPSRVWQTLFWALAFIGLVIGVVVLANRNWVREFLYTWPHVWVVLFGLCWWLWLSPSLVGLIIIFMAVIAFVISPWRGSGSPIRANA